MKTIVSIIILLVCTAQLTAQNVKEALQDHAQIKTGKTHIERDSKELEVFKEDCAMLTEALQIESTANISQLQQKVAASMKREVAQGNSKTKQAGREVVQSTREKRTNRRENRRNRRKFKGTKDDRRDIVRDRRNTRDDRRDKRDDQSDFEEVKQRRNNQKE